MSKPLTYQGIYSAGQIPSSTVDTEFSHIERRKGRDIEYFHCWKYDDTATGPAFPADRIQKSKINNLDRALGVRMNWKEIRKQLKKKKA